MGNVRKVAMMVVWGVIVAGCGVPREGGELAVREGALLGAVEGDEEGVRAALRGQAQAWEEMAALVERRELFGTAVGADFVELVQQTAALARRQGELIAQGEDDPALNRQVLERLGRMWGEVGRYLGRK